ncbi:hypothetical protein SprV_0401717800 [Sparganum proliferum]
MIRQLGDGMLTPVTDNGDVSEAFAVTNGVKQGYVLAPVLFSPMSSAHRDDCPRIRIVYITDGHLLNSRHMQAPTRLPTTTVRDLLFATPPPESTGLEKSGETNRIAAVKSKRTIRKSQAPPIHNADTQPLSSMATMPTNVLRTSRPRPTSLDINDSTTPPAAATNNPVDTPAPIPTAATTTTASSTVVVVIVVDNCLFPHPCHNPHDDYHLSHLRFR